MMMRFILAGLLLFTGAAPAAAEIVATSDTGFSVKHTLIIAAPPELAWQAVTHPGRWWSGAHSYSGDAANISLDPNAGGCWCERLSNGGSVEHMRVINVQPGKLIRFAGGLGPLQSMPVIGVMTITLKADGANTILTLTYAVAGSGLAALAAPVDQVLGEQIPGLKKAAEG